MAGKTNINELARRYVTAVTELAGSGAKLKKLSSDLAEVEGLIASNAGFKRMLTSPLVSSQQQIDSIKEIGKKAKFSDITINFLTVIAKNRRLENLSEILEVFKAHIAEQEGEVKALVTSATKLSAEELKNIAKELGKETKKKIIISQNVDENIVGGLVVQIGSKMYDYSIKSRLERLRQDLRKAS